MFKTLKFKITLFFILIVLNLNLVFAYYYYFQFKSSQSSGDKKLESLSIKNILHNAKHYTWLYKNFYSVNGLKPSKDNVTKFSVQDYAFLPTGVILVGFFTIERIPSGGVEFYREIALFEKQNDSYKIIGVSRESSF